MNAKKTLATVLLSAMLLVGCSDAGPLGPGDTSLSNNSRDVDRLPPVEYPPPVDLPPIEDPPIPEPPVEDPPGDDDGGGKGGGNAG